MYNNKSSSKASYLGNRVNKTEGLKAVLFNLSFGFTKLSFDDFYQSFCGKIFLREAEWVDSAAGIFTKKFMTDAKGLHPPTHPSFDKICAL